MRLFLVRDELTPEYTAGRLFYGKGRPDRFLSYTLERAWNDNLPNVSCIPPGEYYIVPWTRPSGQRALMVRGPGLCNTAGELSRYATRWGILIHPANWPGELQGCIAPGTARSAGAVWNSRQAMSDILGETGQWFSLSPYARLTISTAPQVHQGAVTE